VLDTTPDGAAAVGAAAGAGATLGVAAGVAASAAARAVAEGGGVVDAAKDLGQAAGEALLDLAKTLPFIAPVAYLVGAVVSSACAAVSLRQDCVEFARIVQTLEGVLMKAENLSGHREVVDDLRASLEDALQLMTAMQDRGMLAQMLLSRSDRAQFDDLKDRIEGAIHRLTLSATVDTSAIVRAKFEQSEALGRQLKELGGAEKVAADPDAMDKVRDALEASDQLVVESVQAARRDLRAVGGEVRATHRAVEAMRALQTEAGKADDAFREEARQSLAANGTLQRETSQRMEGMVGKMANLQRESELARLQNEHLKQQVDELKSMLSDVKDCMLKFPMPAREPERMHVVHTGGLLGLQSGVGPQPLMQEACRELSNKFPGVMTMMNIIGEGKQRTAAGFVPVDLLAEEPQAGTVEAGRAFDISGLSVPRKATVCQHVVARGEEVLIDGAGHAHPAPVSPDDLIAAAKAGDGEAQAFLEAQMGSNPPPPGLPFPTAEAAMDEKDALMRGFFEGSKNCTESFYAGVPLQVEGETVGTFCAVAMRKPGNFEAEGGTEMMRQLKAKAEAALAAQVQTQRTAQAQAAVMQMMQAQFAAPGMAAPGAAMIPGVMPGMPMPGMPMPMPMPVPMPGMPMTMPGMPMTMPGMPMQGMPMVMPGMPMPGVMAPGGAAPGG